MKKAPKAEATMTGCNSITKIETDALLKIGGLMDGDAAVAKAVVVVNDIPVAPVAVPTKPVLLLKGFIDGKPTVPVSIDGVVVIVSVMNGGIIPELETVSRDEVDAVVGAGEVVIDDETVPEPDVLDAVPTVPSSLPGIADPIPELVKGVGIGRFAVSGLSAGSWS